MASDFFNLPDNAINTQVFYTKGSGTDFQIWTKPLNVKFVHILCIGSGGGGGGGQASSSGTARRGGAGGGSAGYSFGFFSASQIPDNLFLCRVSISRVMNAKKRKRKKKKKKFEREDKSNENPLLHLTFFFLSREFSYEHSERCLTFFMPC